MVVLSNLSYAYGITIDSGSPTPKNLTAKYYVSVLKKDGFCSGTATTSSTLHIALPEWLSDVSDCVQTIRNDVVDWMFGHHQAFRS